MKEIISAEKHTGDRIARVSWRRCHFSCKQKDEVGGNPNIKKGPSRGRVCVYPQGGASVHSPHNQIPACPQNPAKSYQSHQ